MERASEALVATEYFDAEKLSLKALKIARAADDFERMARICMPLQEARRQIRQIAETAGFRCVVDTDLAERGPKAAGCYLVEPPMIGLDGRNFRELSRRKRVAALVLAREPLTRAGTWPIVAVGESRLVGMVSVRAYVEPPKGTPTASWMCAAEEAVGDAAIARVNPRLPAAFRVDQLLDLLGACPDHEKLHQRLEETCRVASTEPVPDSTLPRAWLDEKYRL
jgi:hypothetical protein